jgi:hypothetical protein
VRKRKSILDVGELFPKHKGVLTLPRPIASWNTIPPSQSLQDLGVCFATFRIVRLRPLGVGVCIELTIFLSAEIAPMPRFRGEALSLAKMACERRSQHQSRPLRYEHGRS